MISQETLDIIAEEFGWLTAADAAMYMTTRKQVAEAMLENFTCGAMAYKLAGDDDTAVPTVEELVECVEPFWAETYGAFRHMADLAQRGEYGDRQREWAARYYDFRYDDPGMSDDATTWGDHWGCVTNGHVNDYIAGLCLTYSCQA
jgi:hypothetical protein